nr:MAG TPA: hypothetical protein [Caudoviricetes sp.]DAS12385.1 MAG TPA: hypothetical protein [Caudoviricetes sp.]DAV00271.1 MAG TPA: hypothetical protein [Caudoviricetes sp.]DAW69146.1 MAG TPA: hypothetical protein [Caudoviricetes sp.]DAX85968.1 MAG TPA: hypothetical protein [Caudoviricetes sp.]
MHKNKHYAIILPEPFATFSIKLRVVFLFAKNTASPSQKSRLGRNIKLRSVKSKGEYGKQS